VKWVEVEGAEEVQAAARDAAEAAGPGARAALLQDRAGIASAQAVDTAKRTASVCPAFKKSVPSAARR
jgi:hypothetical protein